MDQSRSTSEAPRIHASPVSISQLTQWGGSLGACVFSPWQVFPSLSTDPQAQGCPHSQLCDCSPHLEADKGHMVEGIPRSQGWVGMRGWRWVEPGTPHPRQGSPWGGTKAGAPHSSPPAQQQLLPPPPPTPNLPGENRVASQGQKEAPRQPPGLMEEQTPLTLSSVLQRLPERRCPGNKWYMTFSSVLTPHAARRAPRPAAKPNVCSPWHHPCRRAGQEQR